MVHKAGWEFRCGSAEKYPTLDGKLTPVGQWTGNSFTVYGVEGMGHYKRVRKVKKLRALSPQANYTD
jgi:hypothetical protein